MLDETRKDPIDRALKAVGKASGINRDIVSYRDDDRKSLLALVERLTNQKNTDKGIIPVLIRLGTKEAQKNQLYADVLEQLLQDKKLGVSGSIDSIVTNLIGNHKKIELNVQLPISKSNNQSEINLKIGGIEIDTPTQRSSVLTNLLNWAKLESNLPAPKTPFSRLAGGIRPLIYVFDDYSNFISNPYPIDLQVYSCKDNKIINDDKNPVHKFYNRSSFNNSRTLKGAIEGFCHCLNNLSLAFEIKTPNMEFPLDPNADLDKNLNYFEQITKILNFKELDKTRNQIGAFIIDLEWLPSPKWIEQHPTATFDSPPDNQEMGHYAVRLLTQRYPEIPCFIFTGLWSIETLQQSLAAGAAWCFQKPLTHHLGSGSHPSEELNYFNLERHLTEFAKRTYGTYEQVPKPDRFNTHPSTPLSKLEQNMGNKLAPHSENSPSNDRTSPQCTAEDFHHLIARSFTADRVEVVRVIGSGKSGAAATFFVSPTSDRLTEATRFVKIGNWLEIQKEYAAYQQIIKPKLNNHIARIIQPPAVIPNQQTNSSQIDRPNATIVSSLAGFPENYDKLRPLQEIFNNHIGKPNGSEEILPFILETIEYVLLPLQLPTKQKDYYLAAIAPSAYTGSLIPMQSIDFNNRCNAENIICGNNQILTLNEDNPKKCYLQNWIITEIRPLKKEPSKIEVILAHPTLKARIKLKGDKEDAQKRFGALWLKLGMRISVDVEVDPPTKTQEKASKRLTKICRDTLHLDSLADLIEIWNKTDDNQVAVEDPFLLFSKGDEIVKLTSIGQFGGIHGDLNLNNILYPNEEKVGFLIDFSESELEGLAAFDLAWLEAQIWNYYLFPNLIELARSSSLGLCKLLHLALEAMNYCAYPADFFITKISDSDRNTLKHLLNTICNTLTITNSVRQYFTRKLSISFQCDDVHYALAVCFLRQSNFDIESKNSPQNNKLINILSYLCSAHYLKATTSTLKMSDISRS